LTPQKLELGPDGTAAAGFRSESTGTVQLTASSPRFEPAALSFHFEFPGRFLRAAALGGLAGGILQRGVRRGGSARRLALELLVGVVVGAVAFGLFALGVNVIHVDLPRSGGEVLVAVVAAIGAFAGTRLLEPIARVTG
jgi:hypothetical protein